MPTRSPRISVVVTPDVRQFFTASAVNGQGGFQSLCRTLHDRLAATNILRLDSSEFGRIVRYANDYGDGGFQTRLRRIIASWVAQNFSSLIKE